MHALPDDELTTQQLELLRSVLPAEFLDLRQTRIDATRKAAPAFDRLVTLATHGKAGQDGLVARFVACVFDGMNHPFDLSKISWVDMGIGSDMMLCIDAVRWNMRELHELIPDGRNRVIAVIDRWSLTGSSQQFR